MNETVIYLIRHAETVDENGIRNTNEDSQIINEKEILSVEGEEQAKKLSENVELKNLDISTREMLEENLKDYKGTILFVSHDRYFASKISEREINI